MDNPTVIIFGFRFVLVQVDKLARIVVNEKFVIEREVRGLASEISDAITTNLFIVGTHNAGGQIEVEIIGISCVVANPAHSTESFIKELGKGVDKSILPPRVFHKFGKSVFMIYGTVKNFTVQAINVAENR